MRKVPFISGEFYHIYNRGVDKRLIFHDQDDLNRFFQSMDEFNAVEPIGSIYENSFVKDKFGNEASKLNKDKLVNIIVYCLNSNHFHLILEQVVDGGISNFMKRLGGGYTKYFNEKEKRSGSLFQGVFKAVHIDSNEYLLYVSAYINLNDRVHQLGNEASKLASKLVKSKSSWSEYVEKDFSEFFCKKDIILDQFKNKKEYEKFARNTLESIIARKIEIKDMNEYLIESLGNDETSKYETSK